jgi:hypothetical protein
MRNDKATAAAEETAGTHLLDVDHGIMKSNKDIGEQFGARSVIGCGDRVFSIQSYPINQHL